MTMRNGGFGLAPKFPPTMKMRFAITNCPSYRRSARNKNGGDHFRKYGAGWNL